MSAENSQHMSGAFIQETHRDSVHARPKVPVFTLIAERPHKKHGNAIFIPDDLKVKSVSIRDEGNVEFITVELHGVLVFTNLPPNDLYSLHWNAVTQLTL